MLPLCYAICLIYLSFQHLEFRKHMKVDTIITDWRPPEVKTLETITCCTPSAHLKRLLFAGDREVSVRRDVWLRPRGQSRLV